MLEQTIEHTIALGHSCSHLTAGLLSERLDNRGWESRRGDLTLKVSDTVFGFFRTNASHYLSIRLVLVIAALQGLTIAYTAILMLVVRRSWHHDA